MMKIFATFLALTFIISCATDERQKLKSNSNSDTLTLKSTVKKVDTSPVTKLGFFKLKGDSIIIPPFEIEVSLSPKAKEKIIKDHETIIVNTSLSGTPKDASSAELSEDGLFYLASSEKEISYGQVAKFDNIKFSRKKYNHLSNKDFDIMISVYSGRKSSDDNLLDCEFLSERISKVINKRFTIKGKLINGDD